MNRIEREISEREYYDWLRARGFEQPPHDELTAARGIFVAFLMSLPIWATIALLVWNFVRAGLNFDHWSWIVR